MRGSEVPLFQGMLACNIPIVPVSCLVYAYHVQPLSCPLFVIAVVLLLNLMNQDATRTCGLVPCACVSAIPPIHYNRLSLICFPARLLVLTFWLCSSSFSSFVPLLYYLAVKLRETF
eukprot:RCo002182